MTIGRQFCDITYDAVLKGMCEVSKTSKSHKMRKVLESNLWSLCVGSGGRRQKSMYRQYGYSGKFEAGKDGGVVKTICT